MKNETKNRKNYFSEKPEGYIFSSAIGFFTLLWFGLIVSPLFLYLINGFSKNQLSYRHRWRDWFLFGSAFFTISIIAIPSFLDVRGIAYTNLQRNLVHGIKECVVREADNLTTNFTDAQTFSDPNAFHFFVIKTSSDPELKESCFGVRAEPLSYGEVYLTDLENATLFAFFMNNLPLHTWYEINYKNGQVNKTCGNSSRAGCGEGNQW